MLRANSCILIRNCMSLMVAQEITCPEAVKLDDIDSSLVTKNFDTAKSAYQSAEAGSIEQAEAQVELEVNKAMGLALGISLTY